MSPKSQNSTDLLQGTAPILGKAKSCFITGQAHIKMNYENPFGAEFKQGIYVGIDFQPEGKNEYWLLGTDTPNSQALLIAYNFSAIKGRFYIEIRDNEGKTLSGYTQLSNFAAKRVLISIDACNNSINIFETNLLETSVLCPVTYINQQSPSTFKNFQYSLIVGGYNRRGKRQGSYTGKIANLLLGAKVLSDEESKQYGQIFQRQIQFFYGRTQRIQANEERRELFLDDLKKLKIWASIDTLSRTDLRDASVVLFKWLCDRYKLLQEMCDELGVQLTLPGHSFNRRAYQYLVKKDNPIVSLSMTLGIQSSLDSEWVPLREFIQDSVFSVQGYSVSTDAFIKFVRHKLGGGHFDPRNRKKWQRDVLAMSDYLNNDFNMMNHHMKQIIYAVLEAIDGCRIEQQFD